MCPNISPPRPIEKSRLGVILIKCLTGSMLGIRPIYVTRHSHCGGPTDKREGCLSGKVNKVINKGINKVINRGINQEKNKGRSKGIHYYCDTLCIHTRVGHAYAEYANDADYAHMRNMRMRMRIENLIHIIHI